MWCFAVTWFFLTLRQTILWCWKARIQSLCNRIAPHQSASFPRRVKNKSERKTRVYLLGVKANLCLHNSQYSFLLCFSHCTKLGKQRKKDRTQWEWPHGVKQMLLAFPPPLFFLSTRRDHATGILLQTEVTIPAQQEDFMDCFSSLKQCSYITWACLAKHFWRGRRKYTESIQGTINRSLVNDTTDEF